MPKYENPPLVEAWIAFDFETSPDKVSWGKSQIDPFVKSQAAEFARVEMAARNEDRIEQYSGKELPRITDQKVIIGVCKDVQ